MPIFDVRYADGSTVSVEAPEGASQGQIAALANQRRMAAMPPGPSAPAPAERDVTAEAEARLGFGLQTSISRLLCLCLVALCYTCGN